MRLKPVLRPHDSALCAAPHIVPRRRVRRAVSRSLTRGSSWREQPVRGVATPFQLGTPFRKIELSLVSPPPLLMGGLRQRVRGERRWRRGSEAGGVADSCLRRRPPPSFDAHGVGRCPYGGRRGLYIRASEADLQQCSAPAIRDFNGASLRSEEETAGFHDGKNRFRVEGIHNVAVSQLRTGKIGQSWSWRVGERVQLHPSCPLIQQQGPSTCQGGFCGQVWRGWEYPPIFGRSSTLDETRDHQPPPPLG